MASRGYLHPADSFCYMCRQFIKTRVKKYSMEASRIMCEAYKAYFGVLVGDQDKSGAPHFTNEYCKKTLEGWYRGEKQTNLARANGPLMQMLLLHGKPQKIVTPAKCPSDRLSRHIFFHRPSTAQPNLPVPTPPRRHRPYSGDSSKSDSEADTGDMDYDSADEVGDRKPYFPNQKDVNNLIRDLRLMKSNAELLISRLKEWNLVDDSVQVTDQRKRHQRFSNFFSQCDGLCFCNDVASLFQVIGIACNPIEWRLFIDSSSWSFKAVLLHNGNNCPSLLMAHSVNLKEDYTSVKMLLSALKYVDYGWGGGIGDFKMVSFLMGFQGGFSKFPCFLCLWDSHDTKVHYRTKDWPQRTEFSLGKSNVKWEPLIERHKLLMPPLHIKLGLIKQFVTALDKESAAFQYLQALFPKLSEAKVRAGIFVGTQIKNIYEDFAKLLNRTVGAVWSSFVAVVQGFLANHKAENYVELVQILIKNYAKMGCRMSLKVHIFDLHLDKFKENMGAYSEEQGEFFHQDILDFERHYQGQYNENMMGDYIF